jgi:8-oxo-dGTP pyrophosphatase MutT (NUDIX family)
MSRESLLKKLKRYTPSTTEKDVIKKNMILFIESDKNCFDRNNYYGHITASAWLTSQDNRVLLTHHRKLKKWLQLGGHCDNQTDIVKAALKEAIEESGIDNITLRTDEIFDIDIHTIPAHNLEPEHYHFDVRFHFDTFETAYKVSEESYDLRWFSRSELIAGSVPINSSIMHMVNIWPLNP